MLYYIPLIFFTCLSIIELMYADKKIGNTWLVCIAIVLIVFAGFRTVGPDLSEYTNYFNSSSIRSVLQAQGIEPAFLEINKFVRDNDWPIFIMFFIVSIFGVIPKMVFIKKYTVYVFPALVVYYTTIFIIKEMGQIRHGVAIAFALMAFGLMAQKRIGWSLVFTLIALQFHYSAICVLPAYFFVNKEISAKRMLLIIAALFPLVLFDLKPLLTQIVQILPVESAKSKGTFYLNSPMYGFSVGLDSSVVLRLIVLGVMLYYQKTLTERVPYFKAFLNLYFIGICYYLLFSSVSEFAQRTSVYYRTLEIAILPGFITLGKTLGDKLLIGLVIALNGVYTLVKLLENPLGKEMYDRYDNMLFEWIVDFIHVIG